MRTNPRGTTSERTAPASTPAPQSTRCRCGRCGAAYEAPAFEDLAPYIDQPQALMVYSELLGESEVGFVDGQIRTDDVQNVWSNDGQVPTPEELVDELRRRGIAARVAKVQGSRKSGRRSRVFEIQPGSGGPGCRVTIKRRFWDSYDLLSVPEVYESLCQKYHMSPDRLREELHAAKFGIEVRKPALGGASSDLLFDNLLDILEEKTEGIRTEIGLRARLSPPSPNQRQSPADEHVGGALSRS